MVKINARAQLVSLFSERYPDRDYDLIRILAESYNQCDPEVADYYIEGRLDEFFQGFKEELFKDLSCPVLLVCGDPDEGGNVTQEDVNYALSLNPAMQYVMIRGVDHGLGISDGREHLFLDAIKPFLESFR